MQTDDSRHVEQCSRGSGDQIQAHGVSRGGRVGDHPQPRQRRKKAGTTSRLKSSAPTQLRHSRHGVSVAPAGAFLACYSRYRWLAPWAGFSSPLPGLGQGLEPW